MISDIRTLKGIEQEINLAMKTIEINARRISPKRTEITTSDGEFEIGRDGSPLDYLLGSLAGCINVIGSLVADELAIDVESLEIGVAGTIDTDRYQGKSEQSRAGFQEVRLDVHVEADADEETLEEWVTRVQERCPVAENLRNETPLDVSLVTD